MNRPPTRSPWGSVDSADLIAPGIWRIHTASHGGYRLSAERQRVVSKRFPSFKPYAGAGWFEEDCDSVVVELTFPTEFSPYSVWSAVHIASATWVADSSPTWRAISAWLTSDNPAAQMVSDIADSYQRRHADDWRVAALSSCPNSPLGVWTVSLRRFCDNAERRLQIKGYPDSNTYTDEELESMRYTKAGASC